MPNLQTIATATIDAINVKPTIELQATPIILPPYALIMA